MTSGRPLAIEAHGVSKTYGAARALREADFQLGLGEIVGFIGKNGAGKSTLIKILAGVEHPDAGTLSIFGQRVDHHYSPRDATARGLAFVHQELAVVPAMSVAENVVLGTRIPNVAGLVSWAELRRQAVDALDRLLPGIDPNIAVERLSQAHQRIVMLARALHSGARVIVLDEPSASLSDTEVNQLHGIVRGIVGSGGSVVYVSHRLDEIAELSDRVVVMRDGRVTGDHPVQAISRQRMINEISGDDVVASEGVRDVGTTTLAPSAPVRLRVTDLSRGAAVRNVSFELREGEVLGVAGLVGAGRSELARLLIGADKPESGTIELHGEKVRFRSPAHAMKAGIALVPEDRKNASIFPEFDVRRNVTVSTLSSWCHARTPFPSRTRELAVTTEAIARLQIATTGPNQLIRTLSGGNQQKAIFARYMLADPKVFVVDEPALGVDVHAKREIFLLLREFAHEGASIILISSDFTELVEWSDRVIGMNEGRVTGELLGSQLTDRNVTELAYGHLQEASAE